MIYKQHDGREEYTVVYRLLEKGGYGNFEGYLS